MKGVIRKKPSLITIFLLSCLLSLNSVVYADENSHINSLDKQKYTNFELDVVDFKNMDSNVNPCSTTQTSLILKNEDESSKLTDLQKEEKSFSLDIDNLVKYSNYIIDTVGFIAMILILIKYIIDVKNGK